MVAIETHSVSKQFGSFQAVQNLDLYIKRGEVFGFLGPNGAGKSTTINMLLDFVRPTEGEISVFGRSPQKEPQAVRQRVGVLPEATGFYKRATAREHIQFAVKMEQASDDPEEVLRRVGIANVADRPVGEFSTGMRQRLGLGIALVGDPDLLILDEPLTGLDPSGARRLREVVRTERDRGATVFFSSHIMDEVETLCDRVGIMNDGELVTVDSVDQLRTAVEDSSTLVVSLDTIPNDHGVDTIEGVTNVVVRDNVMRVTCAESIVKSTVIRRLDATDATIQNIDTNPISMEEIFLQISDGGSGE